jgi:hypothetical protein
VNTQLQEEAEAILDGAGKVEKVVSKEDMETTSDNDEDIAICA